MAARVNTAAAGSQTFAGATLPPGGGMEHADVDNAAVPNTLAAAGLTSITTGQIDQALVTATASAADTRVELPGVGYVVRNGQISNGDGVHSTSLTVNMIHVYLVDPQTRASVGEIVVGAATSMATDQ